MENTLEDITHCHMVSLMYKLTTSAKESYVLLFVLDPNSDRRKLELTNNKKIKGKNHFLSMLKDSFGFAEHGLG